MVFSFAVGRLAFALCLFTCVYVGTTASSVEGEGTAVTLQQATDAVNDAKKSIQDVSVKAQSNIDNATALLQNMKRSKKQADNAASQAQAAQGNEKATSIVADIKSSSATVNTLYGNAIIELETANSSMVKLLLEAKTMENQCTAGLPSTASTSEQYTEAKNTATNIKTKAENLDTNITAASKIISGVQSKLQQMEESAKKAQLKNLHISGIVAVSQIETMNREAESIITKTNNKKNEVNGIVTKMQTLKEKAPTESIDSINAMFQGANGELTKATVAVANAEKATADITQQKNNADAALTKVEKAIEVNDAQAEFSKAEACVEEVKNIVTQLTNGLTTAENSVINANVSKQEMEKVLLKYTSKPSTGKGGETAKSDPLVGEDRAQSHEKDATSQSTITDKEQTTSTDTISQSNNSGEEIRDKLTNSAQTVPTTALTGGKAPAPGAKNDSAMTVSVPLLVALIASAVLQ